MPAGPLGGPDPVCQLPRSQEVVRDLKHWGARVLGDQWTQFRSPRGCLRSTSCPSDSSWLLLILNAHSLRICRESRSIISDTLGSPRGRASRAHTTGSINVATGKLSAMMQSEAFRTGFQQEHDISKAARQTFPLLRRTRTYSERLERGVVGLEGLFHEVLVPPAVAGARLPKQDPPVCQSLLRGGAEVAYVRLFEAGAFHLSVAFHHVLDRDHWHSHPRAFLGALIRHAGRTVGNARSFRAFRNINSASDDANSLAAATIRLADDSVAGRTRQTVVRTRNR